MFDSDFVLVASSLVVKFDVNCPDRISHNSNFQALFFHKNDHWLVNFCSDFWYKMNGILVLVVGFIFLPTNFDFLTSYFDGIFFISFEKYCCLELNLKRYFTNDHFS